MNLCLAFQLACAQTLLPILLDEEARLDKYEVVHIKREVDVRVTCGKFSVLYS